MNNGLQTMRNSYSLILLRLKLISMRFLYLNNQTLQKLSGWYHQESVSFSANYNIKWDHFRLIPYILRVRSALGIKLYAIPIFDRLRKKKLNGQLTQLDRSNLLNTLVILCTDVVIMQICHFHKLILHIDIGMI